jgi:hypothetical protein
VYPEKLNGTFLAELFVTLVEVSYQVIALHLQNIGYNIVINVVHTILSMCLLYMVLQKRKS